MKVLFASMAALAFSAVASAQLQYGTGFEAADGFVAGGDLNGQNGWAGNVNYDVVNDFARTGSQSVRWTGTGGTYAWVDLANPYDGAQALRSSVWVFIDAATANDERVFGLRLWGNDAGAVYGGSAGVTVDSGGSIRVGDTYAEMYDDSNIAGNVANATGRWMEIMVLYTPGANTATVGVDGQEFAIDVATARTSILDVDLFCDWRDVNANTTGWFDDYSVEAVPEPATLLALSAGVALMARKRRQA